MLNPSINPLVTGILFGDFHVEMFQGAVSFNHSIDNWDVSNVTSMTQMFQGATSFNQAIGNWDLSSVRNIYKMFEGSGLLIRIWVTGILPRIQILPKSLTIHPHFQTSIR